MDTRVDVLAEHAELAESRDRLLGGEAAIRADDAVAIERPNRPIEVHRRSAELSRSLGLARLCDERHDRAYQTRAARFLYHARNSPLHLRRATRVGDFAGRTSRNLSLNPLGSARHAAGHASRDATDHSGRGTSGRLLVLCFGR